MHERSLVVRSGLVGVQTFNARAEYARNNNAPQIRGAVLGASNDCGHVVVNQWNIANDTTALQWLDLATKSSRPLFSTAAQERQTIEFLGEMQPIIVPFAPAPVLSLKNDRLYSAFGNVAEIRTYDTTARLVRIVRWNATARHSRRPIAQNTKRTACNLTQGFGWAGRRKHRNSTSSSYRSNAHRFLKC